MGRRRCLSRLSVSVSRLLRGLVLHVLSRRQGACLRCGLGATGTARNEWQNAAVREVIGKWLCQWALHPPLQV